MTGSFHCGSVFPSPIHSGISLSCIIWPHHKFVCQDVDRCLQCFPCLAVAECCHEHFCVTFLRLYLLISLGESPGGELLCCQRPLHTLKLLCLFLSHCDEGTCSSHQGCNCSSHCFHAGGCEHAGSRGVASPCGLDLHFANDPWH